VNRLAVLIVLLAGSARADDGDDVDDHPLAADLRAAFGRDLSVCRGTPGHRECELVVAPVSCTTRDGATTCRAGKRKASGAAAERLSDHLRTMAENRTAVPDPKPATVTIASIVCSSYPLEGEPKLRGHCGVERTDGDAVFDRVLTDLKNDDGTPLLEMCKLGQFCWTGTVQATCKSNRCKLTCPPASDDSQWLDGCHLPGAVTTTSAAFARNVHARAHAATAQISCFTSAARSTAASQEWSPATCSSRQGVSVFSRRSCRRDARAPSCGWFRRCVRLCARR
jgi:hypothetical protein